MTGCCRYGSSYARPRKVAGPREQTWLGGTVTWHHRTIEDYVAALQSAGFALTSLRECAPYRERFDGDDAEFPVANACRSSYSSPAYRSDRIPSARCGVGGADDVWVESSESLIPDPVHALLLVDVQNAFITGPDAVPGADGLIRNLGELLRRAREAGALVVHLQNDGPRQAVDEPDQPGWELHLPVCGSERELVVRKTSDDGFVGTPLADLLDRHGVTRICVGGVLSEMCVAATARSALARGFGVLIPHDAHATHDIAATPGISEGIPAAVVARVAEWSLGDQIEVVARAGEVSFAVTAAHEPETG